MKKTQRGIEVNKVHIEIDELELSLSKNPKDLNGLLRLMNLYIDDGKLTRCKTYFESLKRLTSTTRLSYTQGMSIIDIYLRYWKAEKYAPVLSSGMNEGGGGSSSSIRLNISSERSNYLHDICSIMESILKTAEGSRSHLLLSRRAYVLECMGEFQTSLAALSELISIQANDGVDLSYVIFKAAIMLHHIGQLKQSVEYLEFILDDPPSHDGYSRSHVFAYLTLVYEQSGDIYKSLVSKSYDSLLDALSIDMPNNNKAIVTNNKKQFSQQSDIWESLAVQAVDRCEYVLAMGFLTQAINKASNKAKLLHLLAEVYVSTKQNTLALEHAENAYSLNNQSVELRNLLLQLSPDKWGDSLRSMAPSRASTAIGDDDFDNLDDEMSLKDLYKSANPKTKNNNNKKVVESPARQEATKKMKSVKDRATKHQSAAIVETTPTAALIDHSSSNEINATHGVNTDSISMEKELCAVVVDSTVDSAEGKSSNDILTTESERHMEDEVREINDASDNNVTADVVIVPDPSVTPTMQHEPIQDDVVAITTIPSTATTTTSEATVIPVPVLEEPKMIDTSHNELLIGMPATSSNSPSPLTTTATTTTAMMQANNQPLTSEQIFDPNDDASSRRSTSSPPDSWLSRGFKSLSPFKPKSANKKREMNSNDRDVSPNDMSNSNSRNIIIGSSSRPSTVKEQESRKEVSDSISQASTAVPVSNRQSVTPTIVRSPSRKRVPLQTSLSKKNNTDQNRSFFGNIFSSKNKDDLKVLNDVADDDDNANKEEDNNDDNSNNKRYDNTNRKDRMKSSRAQSPLHNSSALSKPVLNASERRILNKVLSGNTNVS